MDLKIKQCPEVEVIKAIYAAINRSDIDALFQYLDPQIERIEPQGFPTSGTYRGHAEIKTHLSNARATWAEGTCEPVDAFVFGEKTVVYLHVLVRLKNKTEWIDARFPDGFLFRDGKVLQWCSFAKRDDALAWVGVSDSSPDDLETIAGKLSVAQLDLFYAHTDREMHQALLDSRALLASTKDPLQKIIALKIMSWFGDASDLQPLVDNLNDFTTIPDKNETSILPQSVAQAAVQGLLTLASDRNIVNFDFDLLASHPLKSLVTSCLSLKIVRELLETETDPLLRVFLAIRAYQLNDKKLALPVIKENLQKEKMALFFWEDLPEEERR